jgi:SH3-like domain-containing protein
MRLAAAFALVLAATPAAAEFRSLGETTVLYDAPSTRAKKLYVASRGTPVEVIIQDGPWVKVRDASGELTWLERKSLADVRTVVVSAPTTDVRAKPEDGAALVFQAQSGVVLELVEVGTAGWVRVRHRDGASGYARANQLWGAQ